VAPLPSTRRASPGCAAAAVLTKIRLATAVGVDLRSIAAYEGGEFAPEQDRLSKLAPALKFPEAFFCGEDLEEPALDTASFRSMS
jgi:transcriptional regulator with XRE-family HTH domain